MPIVFKGAQALVGAVIVCGATIMGAGAAHAETHPGACLEVQNNTGKYISITVNYPDAPWEWDFNPHEGPKYLTHGDDPITSPDGHFEVSDQPNMDSTFIYNEDANRNGCNGAWVLIEN